ncbi:MAG: class I SAM-dependent methyltransferase [Solirubrobacterales bacterium]
MSAIKKQTFRERARSVLKSIWYSPRFRAVAFAPVDALDRIRGRDPLLPPRRLQYVGRREDFAPVGAYWRDRLVRDNGLGPDGDVLDIGCGIGRAAVALIPQLPEGRYEGFDVVPQFIAWCSREITSRHPNFRFQVADVRNRQYNPRGDVPPSAYEFPFAADGFDAALAASVFTHMEPDGVRRYLGEAVRVLRPGGVLVATFFLVDAATEELLAGTAPAFRLDHRLTDAAGEPYLAADPRVPEFCVGLFEAQLLTAAAEAGFEPGPDIERGWWSGREVPAGAPYQDVVTLRKPA